MFVKIMKMVTRNYYFPISFYMEGETGEIIFREIFWCQISKKFRHSRNYTVCVDQTLLENSMSSLQQFNDDAYDLITKLTII